MFCENAANTDDSDEQRDVGLEDHLAAVDVRQLADDRRRDGLGQQVRHTRATAPASGCRDRPRSPPIDVYTIVASSAERNMPAITANISRCTSDLTCSGADGFGHRPADTSAPAVAAAALNQFGARSWADVAGSCPPSSPRSAIEAEEFDGVAADDLVRCCRVDVGRTASARPLGSWARCRPDGGSRSRT